MSLNTRLNRYYANHILAHLRVSPSPSSAAEVQHLYNSFKTVGNLEYFRVPRLTSVGRFSSHCFALFNPTLQSTIVTPFTVPDQEFLLQKSESLVQKLHSLIAIPRYSYIENDQSYHDNETEIPFKYSLTKDGLALDNKYEVSSSSAGDPFCCVLPVASATVQILRDADVQQFRREVRHNFQKFHKFSSVEINSGIEAVNLLGAEIVAEDLAPEKDMKVEDLINFSKGHEG